MSKVDIVGGEDSDVLFWLRDEELSGLLSSTFWNNEELEKTKAYYIIDGNSERLWTYLHQSTTYYEQYLAVLKFAEDIGCAVRGTGVDLAAGVCWTTAFLSRVEAVERVYAVEISRHRLLKLAPVVFDALHAVKPRIARALGSFYDVKLPEASVDFCFLAQAFHHADDPRRLLGEVHRLLKPSQPALMIGEVPIYSSSIFMKRLKNLLKFVVPASCYVAEPIRRLWPSFEDLFPPNRESGDHYYRLRDYAEIFEEAGFELHQRRVKRDIIFIAVRK